MRSIVRLLFLACLAAAVLVPAATAADRMWVGFQDDPMFRWDGARLDALDRARANNATILRTIVDWTKVAPTRPAQATDPFDPAYQFGDVDETRGAVSAHAAIIADGGIEPGWARTRSRERTPNCSTLTGRRPVPRGGPQWIRRRSSRRRSGKPRARRCW